jgi:hypothetical protein
VTDFTTTFEQFLLWERASRDTLEVKRIYVDMAGDLVAGLVLSQIVYWHLPNREGKARLRVQKHGQLWLAKGRAEWWHECRISPKQADRALNLLQSRGLIEVKLFKFGAAPTKHVRILREGFLNAWKARLAQETGLSDSEMQSHATSEFAAAGKSISTKGQNQIRPMGEMDFSQKDRSLTETTTEITTTAAPSPATGFSNPAAAALIDELVSHGVSRSSARRFATQSPEVCRRCLEYLPFANVRTTRGAWLANAIEHEFGPPAAYEKAMAQRAAQENFKRRERAENARKASHEARRNENAARLMERYRKFEQEQGEGYRAFIEHLERQRARAAKFAARLSEAGKAKYLDAFDSTAYRLEIFDDWLRSNLPPDPVPANPPISAPTPHAE